MKVLKYNLGYKNLDRFFTAMMMASVNFRIETPQKDGLDLETLEYIRGEYVCKDADGDAVFEIHRPDFKDLFVGDGEKPDFDNAEELRANAISLAGRFQKATEGVDFIIGEVERKILSVVYENKKLSPLVMEKIILVAAALAKIDNVIDYTTPGPNHVAEAASYFTYERPVAF